MTYRRSEALQTEISGRGHSVQTIQHNSNIEHTRGFTELRCRARMEDLHVGCTQKYQRWRFQ